jgi:WD40 repeat protein
VFRDEASLSANPQLWSSITAALDSSGWFVLLLSPEAASSPWVNREVEYWLAHRDPTKLLPVLTEGEFGWEEGSSRLKGGSVPPALVGAFSEEPRWVDLRWARDDIDLDLRNSRFRGAVADLAAAIRGVPKEDLESEEVRQHRRTTRTAWAAAAALVLLALTAGGAAFYANDQRGEAEAQRLVAEEQSEIALANEARAEDAAREAQTQRLTAEDQASVALSRGLAAQAISLTSTRVDLALLLSVQGFLTDSSPQALQSLLTVIAGAQGLTGFQSQMTEILRDFPRGQAVQYHMADTSLDGSRIALATSDGRVFVFETDDWNLVGRPFDAGIGPVDNNQTDSYATTWVSLSGDGSRLAYSNPSGVFVFQVGSGLQVGAEIPIPRVNDPPSVDLNRDGTLVLTAPRLENPQFEATVWSVDSGEIITRVDLGSAAGAVDNVTYSFSPSGDEVVHAGGNTVIATDIATGVSRSVQFEDRSVWGAAISPDETAIAIAMIDPVEVSVLDFGTLVPIGPSISPALEELRAVDFSPDSGHLSLGSEEGRALIYEVPTGRLQHSIVIGDGYPISVVWSSATGLVGASPWGVSEWDIATPSALMTQYDSTDEWLAISGDNETVMALAKGMAYQSTFGESTSLPIRECSDAVSGSVELNAAATRALVQCRGSSRGQLVILDLAAGEVRSVLNPSFEVTTAALSPDGDRVVGVQVDGTLVVFDAETGAQIHSQPGPPVASAIEWFPNGENLVIGGRAISGEDLLFYESDSWSAVGATTLSDVNVLNYNTARALITDMAISPDGAHLYVSRDDGTVWVVDVSTYEPCVSSAKAGLPFRPSRSRATGRCWRRSKAADGSCSGALGAALSLTPRFELEAKAQI